MTKANKAISLGISALVVIALIIIVAFGVYLNSTLYPTLDTTYTKATDITVIPSPPFTPSIVCTNTTSIQHTTLTCTAIATSSSSSSSSTFSTSNTTTISKTSEISSQGTTMVTTISSSSTYPSLVYAANLSGYFPNGYYSQSVNITNLKDGDNITLGQVRFQFIVNQNVYVTTVGNQVGYCDCRLCLPVDVRGILSRWEIFVNLLLPCSLVSIIS